MLKEAWATLSDAQRRAPYDRELGTKPSSNPGPDAPSDMTVTTCPGCGNALRVPAHKRGLATCPRSDCRRVFNWVPERLEFAELSVGCAVTGAAGTIEFSRTRDSEPFTIRPEQDAAREAGEPGRRQGSAVKRSFDSDDLSFNGFRCPSCNFRPQADIGAVVQCSQCGKLYCGGSVKKNSAGERIYYCPCGNRGEIGGVIESFEARKLVDAGPKSLRRSPGNDRRSLQR